MLHKIDFDATTFKPRKGHLLVKVKKPDDEVKTESGIVTEIKRSTLDRPCYGRVEAANTEDDIPVGTNVVFPNTDGIDCSFNGIEGYVLLKVESVIGLVGYI